MGACVEPAGVLSSTISSIKKTPGSFQSHLGGIENSPSMNNSTLSTTTLHNATSNNNHKADSTFSDSAMGSTSHNLSGPLNLDDYSTRLNSDAISVGSNDSGDVRNLKFEI